MDYYILLDRTLSICFALLQLAKSPPARRTVASEYLIAMKLMSGRRYKNDLSDIAGILLEHQKQGNPISQEMIGKAITKLYGETATLPSVSQKTILNRAEQKRNKTGA